MLTIANTETRVIHALITLIIIGNALVEFILLYREIQRKYSKFCDIGFTI